MSSVLVRTIILLGLITISKGHGFIRVVVLAALGLAGLWMLHTLAQDYHKISAGQKPPAGAGGGKLFFEKRAIFSNEPRINWGTVLASDPASCARSFICQLSAQDEETLDADEKKILQLSRYSDEYGSWASKQLQEAIKYGEQAANSRTCMERYKLCPFSSKTMTSLLRIFGRKK